MMIPKDIHLKAAEIVSKIEHGNIVANDIELLLIWLREFSADGSVFREISHFIAHPNRNCGQTFEALYRLYCRWRAYAVYQYKKNIFNLRGPFDKWLFDFLIYQIEEIGSKRLKMVCGLSQKKSKKLLKVSFNNQDGEFICKEPDSPQIIAIVKEAFSFIKVSPLYEKKDIIGSFQNTLFDLNLISSKDSLSKEMNKVLLCLLVLMNKRAFNVGQDVIGNTTLTAPNDGFGRLQPLELRGTIQVPDLPNIVFTLVNTDFGVDDWAHHNLLIQKDTNIKGHYWTVFDEAAHIRVNEIDGKFMLNRYM